MDPIHPTLATAINASIGGALAWANVLEPGEAYVAGRRENDSISMPLEVASAAIRVRRGDARLRAVLCRSYRNRCAISGECPKDLLEAAYIAPYPAGDVHSPRNAIPLRADLHTLWDLNLIAVNPDTLEVCIASRLRGTFYESFTGATLAQPGGANDVDRTALKERWSHFRAGEAETHAEPGTSADHEQSKRADVETLADFEPKKSSASGIWKPPPSAAPSGTVAEGLRSISAVADVIPMEPDEVEAG